MTNLLVSECRVSRAPKPPKEADTASPANIKQFHCTGLRAAHQKERAACRVHMYRIGLLLVKETGCKPCSVGKSSLRSQGWSLSEQAAQHITSAHLQVLVLLTFSVQAVPDVVGLVCYREKGSFGSRTSHTQM